ncbi:MAG: peptidylprolyl isomerase [Elusimicrobia bacterium]|nr:peptidylprolyl isomerase [Elusimicrobiota bacterium]
MIDDRLLLQESKKRKLRVNQRDLESGVIQVKSRFLPEAGRRELETILQKQMASRPPNQAGQDTGEGMDLAAAWQQLTKSNPGDVKEADAKFKEELAKEGLNDKKFEERIRDQLSVVQLTGQEVRSRAKTPSDEEVKKLYEQIQQIQQGKDVAGLSAEQKADLESLSRYFTTQTGERIRARHVLIRVPKDSPFKEKSQAYQKAEDLHKKIKGGEDFAELAEKFSDDKASAVNGGDLGFFTRGQMVASFEKAAFGLGVGEVSDVVETDFGFHIIKVEEKKAATKPRLQDVQDDLKEYLFRVNQQQVFEGFVKDLRKGASIKVLADVNELSKQ